MTSTQAPPRPGPRRAASPRPGPRRPAPPRHAAPRRAPARYEVAPSADRSRRTGPAAAAARRARYRDDLAAPTAVVPAGRARRGEDTSAPGGRPGHRDELTRAALASGGAALAPARRPSPVRAPQEARRHLRVVAPDERRRRRLTPAAGVVLTAGLFVMLFLVAIAQTVLVQGQVRLDGLDAQVAVEQARYQELRREVAEMESPERIVAEAEALGMVSPEDLVYIQPPAPAADEPAAPSADDEVDPDSRAGTTWSVMKPLLEAPGQ